MAKEKVCGHGVWVKDFPFELVGYSSENSLALVFCKVCEEQFWTEFKMYV